jgi:hypothetical protein
VNDLISCAQRTGCVDEACLATSCDTEVRACAGSTGPDAGPRCETSGKPEMTGPIGGLAASYGRGDPMDVVVPVDEDTQRVIVGIYEVGTMLYLGGTAEDVTPSSSAPLSLFAGVAGGKRGMFYLAVELCSTQVCTTPFVRNTYQRADRFAPLAPGELYVQTREFVGGPAMPEACPTAIPIQTFTID